MAARGTISWEELHPAFNRLAQRFDAIEAQLSILSEKLGVPFTPLDAQVPPRSSSSPAPARRSRRSPSTGR